MSAIKLIKGHWYEFENYPTVLQYGDGAFPVEPPLRDLTIGPDNLITAEDVGRWYLGTECPQTIIDTVIDSHVGAGIRLRVGYWRFLSARECKERGLAATHPSQVSSITTKPTGGTELSPKEGSAPITSSTRKPGEFRVGDRVRVLRDQDVCARGDRGTVCGHSRFGKNAIGVRFDTYHPGMHGLGALADEFEGCETGYGWFLVNTELELIEPSLPSQPAREGDAAIRKDAESPASEPTTSPPAPSHDSVHADALGMKSLKTPRRPLSREQRYQLALEVLCGWQEVR